MMRRLWLPTVIALVVLLLLVLALPARLCWTLLQPSMPAAMSRQLTLQGISGTWWSGHAASLHWLGQHRGQLDWHLVTPTTFALQLTHPQHHLQARLGLGDVSLQDQRLRLHHIDVSMAAAALPTPWPQIRLQGQLQAQLQQVTLQYNRQLVLQGEVNWHSARLAGAMALDLGTVAVHLQGEQQHTTVQISNHGSNDVQVRGAGTLHADRYALQLLLRPHSGRDEMQQQLAWLGTRQPDGSYALSIQGVWP